MPKNDELRRTFDAYIAHDANVTHTARSLGIARPTVRRRIKRCAEELNLSIDKPIAGGKVHAYDTETLPLPKKGEVFRYVLTSAQNNTKVNAKFLKNLIAFCNDVNARLMVSRFTYNKSSWSRKSVKPGHGPTAEDLADLWYDRAIDEKHYVDHRVELAPMLTFCGEINILPTAKRPLTGFETYVGRSSAIFPHAKIALTSVAGTADDKAKINYTTGTCTLRNYVQKRAGLQAEHHHTYGAVIVEVDADGDWFVRQINATQDGSFYDLGTHVADETVTHGHTIEGVNWGDLHTRAIDEDVAALAFEENGILDTLKPSYQFAHDIVDFNARNHHEIKNPHSMFKRFVLGGASVREEFEEVANLIQKIDRPWCKTIVVDSNHDNALDRWLTEADYRIDPENAVFFLERQLAKYKAYAQEQFDFHSVKEALRDIGVPDSVEFLGPDDSFVICDDASGGIECGMHGHNGPNGSRGSPLGLSRIGRRANTGHTHSATIIDGLYVAGTFTRLRLDYTKGPSSWTHSFIVTYPNGKRTIITIFNGKWRAP